MPSFSDLGLAEAICRALDAATMPSPTTIQLRAIPPLLEGHDLVAIAPAGAGKTAAYLLPLAHRLGHPAVTAESKAPRAIVLTSDRDRAEPIGRAFADLARYVSIRCAAAADAAGWNRQAKELRTGVELVVATPKQLLELQRERAIGLQAVEMIVLDDADEMLERGMWPELERIARELPERRQGALFAAATSPELDELARAWLRDWEEVDAPAPKKRLSKTRSSAAPDPTLQVDPSTPPELPSWLDEKPKDGSLPDWLDNDDTVESTDARELIDPDAPFPPPEPAPPEEPSPPEEPASPPPRRRQSAAAPKAPPPRQQVDDEPELVPDEPVPPPPPTTKLAKGKAPRAKAKAKKPATKAPRKRS